jgi:predicted RNase H-like HicB family nuclease
VHGQATLGGSLVTEYIAIIHKDPDHGYAVTFADFPDLIAFAAFLEGAPELAASRLTLHLEEKGEAGEALPKPRSLAIVEADPLYVERIAAVTLIRGSVFWTVGSVIPAHSDEAGDV